MMTYEKPKAVLISLESEEIMNSITPGFSDIEEGDEDL